ADDVARADDDVAAGAGEPHRQTEAEGAGGADDGDRLGQARRGYPAGPGFRRLAACGAPPRAAGEPASAPREARRAALGEREDALAEVLAGGAGLLRADLLLERAGQRRQRRGADDALRETDRQRRTRQQL